MNMEIIGKTAWWLVVLAAINVGLAALIQINIIEQVFGAWGLAPIINILVGAAGVYMLATSLTKK